MKSSESVSYTHLLYVCLTRPLHELAVLYGGELTPLLCEARELSEGR